MRHPNVILSLVAIALLAPVLAFGQVTTALLQGRVLDQSGAVIPGASIEAHNLDTGLRRTATADQDGSYRILALPIGPYEITASAGGFASEIRSGVTLRVGQQATVDFALRVAAGESITITAEAPIIEVTESAIATTITTQQIDQLPLPNRNFTELASLTPGVQNSVTEGGSISASGGTGSSNTFLIDGVSGDAEALGGQRTTLSPDVVAEFEVLSSQYSAEFGRASGAVINVVTRAGTNDMRGRLSAFYRDDSLNEDNPFAITIAGEETPFTQEIFSSFLGGPFRRDRAFYFGSWEHSKIDSTALITTPTAVLAALGQDTDRTVESPTDQDRALLKIDFNLTPEHVLGLRADLDELVQENAFVGGTITREAGVTQRLEEQNVVLSHTWIVSSEVVNDLRFQYGTEETNVMEVNCPGCPLIIRPSVITGKLNNLPQRFEEQRLQLVEALSFEVLQKGGDHSFKLGADISQIELPLFVPQNFDGIFQFTTDKPFDPNDRTTFPAIYQVSTGDPSFVIDSNIYGVFFQDQWRMTPNFTLNLGLRWDYEDHAMIGNDTDNFAPRLHFAWDPFGHGKSLVRGGAGIYYDTVFLNAPLIGVFLEAGRYTTTTILSPGYPDPRSGGQAIALPPATSVIDANAETPSTTTASVGFAHEVLQDLALSADLVYADGDNQMIIIDGNAPVGGRRPDPAFGQKLAIQTRGRSEYKGLHLGLRKRFGGRYSLNAAYTLAENERTADSHRSFVSNSNNPDVDFGSSSNDVRHTFNAALNVNAPWGINIGLGGSFRSAAPYNITTGRDDNGDAIFNDRPAGAKRNSGRGDDVYTVNLRLAKLITFSDIDLELIGEAFNLFDTVNETGYIGNMRSARFGQPANVLTGAFGPRQIQLGVRLDF